MSLFGELEIYGITEHSHKRPKIYEASEDSKDIQKCENYGRNN